MKRLVCFLLAWHWLILPIEPARWHSDAKRFGRRCRWCGRFESHPWFSDSPGTAADNARKGKQ